ncbi:DNA-binding CsgD family transcriptional regulator [Mycobacterium sp. OAS707]|uniref:ATP-binding protein n=1 Tax=Mycobacterium sp. OAS707 TaxID=2663822 RepID=UPI00178C0325|nr:LuxR family transcriptional regulator [Mycobacterium sp. OAS707]MBE1552659.1 DNA-binding CsgD family transcriptional regulator [Mycobacterium sp. OAS707]
MTTGMASRPAEQQALGEFLTVAAQEPAALLLDGEAGIGKTTLLHACLARARALGFVVLSARAVDAESVLAYGSLADLLADVDASIWADLPAPQRIAIDRMLVREQAAEATTDKRAVAAAFLSVIDRLTDSAPVLVAIDDLQWLDPSSANVIAYAARRLSGPVGLLATVRTEPDNGGATAWLHLPRPDAVHRITVQPLPSRALETIIKDELGRTIPRPVMARIHQMSAGNPFYAIELARAFVAKAGETLPSTLAELVRVRIGGLDSAAQEVLLAAACLATPTVEVVGEAVGVDQNRLIELVETSERHGIIAIEGNRIRFTHPLLASGVYADASSTQRRSMHRRLAGIVDELELRARHLALGSTTGDTETFAALDDAAASAHARGAPAAAAELLELAIGLGGDTPERRIKLAINTFDAGEPARARVLLEKVIADVPAGPLRAEARYALAVVRFIDDGYLEASALLQRALDEDNPGVPLQVRMSTTLAYALYMTGAPDTAWQCAEKAVVLAERLGHPGLLSEALGARATIRFFVGGGIDDESLRRALELEDHNSFTPIMLRPSVEHALILACIGELDASYDRMQAIERRCTDRGEEGELIFVDFYVVVNRIWRGDLGEARRLADDVRELARQLDAEFPAMLSLVLQAWLAVYGGSEDEARQAVVDAIDASKRSGTAWHEGWALTALGFLEVSLGNYGAAVDALQPLLSAYVPDSTEINAASFMPDAVQALTATGRADEAEPLVEALERNGRRLDRAWMRAVGARGRAMVQAARGDTDAAVQSARAALVEHDRLPMPFERARTQLLLGQLLRRERAEATAVLREALAVFEELGTPLWADRARAELAGTRPRVRTAQEGLTPAEQRVAELAASGMTNRDVAAMLFISAKTVEATLARVYRKLGIRSRAELGRHMDTIGQ